jgi:hypothetical protein
MKIMGCTTWIVTCLQSRMLNFDNQTCPPWLGHISICSVSYPMWRSITKYQSHYIGIILQLPKEENKNISFTSNIHLDSIDWKLDLLQIVIVEIWEGLNYQYSSDNLSSILMNILQYPKSTYPHPTIRFSIP